ncbi:hypothetical protein [Dongia sp. agr-C8]
MANAATGRLYVIGDRDTGVLFVKTEPLRASIVPLTTIARYAGTNGISLDEAFARIARGAKSMIIDRDNSAVPALDPMVFDTFFDMVKNGTVISDASFCFIAEVQNAEWENRRYRYPPVGPALKELNPETSSPSGDALKEVELMDGQP